MKRATQILTLALSIYFLNSIKIIAQDVAKVELIARYDSLDNAILLRWAPNTSRLWLLAMEQGYTLEKFIYQKDGKVLPAPLEKISLSKNISPQPLDEWEEIALENDYAAIAAQSIYGEYMAFDRGGNDIFSIVNKAKEQDSRFSMTLFAADQSTEIADKAGLFFKDQNIQKNERYLYRVYANVQDSIIEADTGLVFFGAEDYAPLPRPSMSNATQEDSAIQLYWLKAPFLNVFTNFIIQRTQDLGTEFKSINQLPVINTASGPVKKNNYGIFVDTAKLEGTVYYRIIGEDAFGIQSMPSDTLSVEIMPDFEMPVPQVDSVYSNGKGEAVVKFSFSGDSKYIDKVFFERASKADGIYSLIKSDSINTATTFKDTAPLSNNYYRIGVSAFDKIQYSFPSLFTVMDSIPPLTPEFINYTIEDSVLTIQWKANEEQDIAGYRLYKSQFRNQEPSMVADRKSLSTSIQLIENLKFTNNERFFFLSAFDRVGNTSKLSLALKVILPDEVPPTPPAIMSVKQSSDTLQLFWNESSSDDVKDYLIYRKSNEMGNYQLVGVQNSSTKSYNDFLSIDNSTMLTYRLVAVDSSGNESFSKPYKVHYRKSKELEVEYRLVVEGENISISWDTAGTKSFSKTKIYLIEKEGLSLIREEDFSAGNISFVSENRTKDDFKIIFL